MEGTISSSSSGALPYRSPTEVGDTKDAILDSAERLLAHNDLATVTLRAIAQEAGVDPASVTYHFGGKMDLVAAVIRRRGRELRARRMDALTSLLAESHDVPTAREILDTVYRPWFELVYADVPGWRTYSRLIASMLPSVVFEELLTELAGPWEQVMTTALNRAYPEAGPEALRQAYTLTVGAAISFAAPPRSVLLFGPHDESFNMEVGYVRFLDFVAAGFESIAAVSTN